MIIQNSEREYKGYIIGLCSGKDSEGEFFEAYYRLKGATVSGETYTENNFWQSAEKAYAGVQAEIDRVGNYSCPKCGREYNREDDEAQGFEVPAICICEEDADTIPAVCRVCGGENEQHRTPNCYGG